MGAGFFGPADRRGDDRPMTRFHPLLLAALLVGAGSFAPSDAHAQAGAGAVRLGADLSVLTVSHYPAPDLPIDTDPSVIFGFYNSVAGFENVFLFAPQLGYAVTDDLLVGTHVGFALASFAGSDVGFGFHLVPFLEYMFGGGGVRPFVGAEVGPRFITVPGSDASVTLVAGGYGGVHVFAGDSFSVSPFARVDFLYNSANERAGYEIVLGVSVHGWMGGGAPSPGVAAELDEDASAAEDG